MRKHISWRVSSVALLIREKAEVVSTETRFGRGELTNSLISMRPIVENVYMELRGAEKSTVESPLRK